MRKTSLMSLGEKPDQQPFKNAIYARVSGRGQKDGLRNRVEFLRRFPSSSGVILLMR